MNLVSLVVASAFEGERAAARRLAWPAAAKYYLMTSSQTSPRRLKDCGAAARAAAHF